MASGTPYIGSKISLISKAEIRYEGVLYDVDSKEATVTLSKVKSHGTENRQAPKQIPPRSEVYEYIIFRGSDIKDLTVSEMGNKEESPHLDPAIVSARTTPPVPSTRSDTNPALRPRSSVGGSSILPTPPHPGQPGGGYTQFPPGLGGYNPFGMPYFGRPPMMMGQPLHPMHPPSNQHQQPHLHTPPAHISTITSGDPNVKNTQTPTNLPGTTPPAVPSTNADTLTPGSMQPMIQQQTHSSSTLKTDSQATKQSHQSTPSELHGSTTTPPKTTTKPDSPRNREEGRSNSPVGNEEGRRQPRRGGGGGRREGQRQSNYIPRGGPRVVNNWRGGGGGERGYTRTPRGGSGGGYHAPNRAPPPTVESKPLKYTKDFDFESANALFSKDQFEKEMELKLKISDDKKEGGSDGDEPITSEHEEPEEGEIEEVPTEGAGHKVDEFYDKSKSFFDSISCESTQSNTNRRTNRSQEMALNTETFGVTNRGYSGRPRGNQGRGGYNPRYRGDRGYYNQYNGYRGGRGGYQGRGYYWGRGGRNFSRSYDGPTDYQDRGSRNS